MASARSGLSRKVWRSIIVSATLAAPLAVCEIALRLAFPWLVPERGGYSKATGLPEVILQRKILELQRRRPEVVFIGDSFVATGDQKGGWIERLRASTRLSIGAVGFSATCPSQYVSILETLRSDGVQSPAILVLYLGNDFTDEGIWDSLGDRSRYPAVLHAHYANPASADFWPCFEAEPSGAPAVVTQALERTALGRAVTLLWSRVQTLGASEETADAQITALTDSRCDKPPWAERVRGRLFFFRHHEAVISETGQIPKQGRHGILTALKLRVDPTRTSLLVLLDREDLCRDFHRRSVSSARPFVNELQRLGFRVLDPFDDLAAACTSDNIFLPDGHLNARGHRVLADWLGTRLPRVLADTATAGAELPASASRRARNP